METPRVFISYSSGDADWASSFALALRERGIHAWVDRMDVTPGTLLSEAVEAALRDSDVLVTIIGSSFSASPALFFDLGAAIGMNKRVVPIVAKEIDPQTLPAELRLRKYVLRQTPEETAEELSRFLPAA